MAKDILGVIRESRLCTSFTACCLVQRKETERITEGKIVRVEMEVENSQTCVDPALEILKRLNDELPQHSHLKNPVQVLPLDLRFFEMFYWGLEYWDYEAQNDLHLVSVITAVRNELRPTVMMYRREGRKDSRASSHLERIKQCKPQVGECCIHFLRGTFKCKSSKNEEFSQYARDKVGFMLFILENLEVLDSTVRLPAIAKQQIQFVKGKLKLFGNFIDLVSEWTISDKKLDELLFHTQTWINHISCLTCLYRIVEMDELLLSNMVSIISNLMQKTMPYTPEVMALYLDVLKATRYQKFKTFGRHELDLLVARYVDFLLENLDIHMKKYDEIFREGLVFLLTFVMDPPEGSEDSMICAQIDTIMSQVPFVICSIHLDEMKAESSVSRTMVFEFLEKIDKAKAEIGEVYVLVTHLSKFNSPRTNAMGFLNFLLGNLKKMLDVRVNFIPSVMHRVAVVRKELASIRPLLQSFMELQNEHEKIKALCTQIFNMVYYADYATKLTSVIDVPVWYSIICLSNVIEHIKFFKIEIKEIQDLQINKSKKLSDEGESSGALRPKFVTSNIEGAFIGFKEDARSIMDQLKGGGKELTIICISGMPGQGKTTLAKRIYDDPSIRYHFHEIVWCNVSKECKTRELMIDIVSAVTKVDADKILKLEIHDLAECLWKSLRGKRYLIVMDDIWEVDVWHEVQRSFPDDSKGSRILFTSRNHNLVTEAKPNSISHPLQLFSDEESWELMKEKLFSGCSGASEFLELGKQIAIYCNGLPLAVVLIAALLGRTERKLDLWKQVAENLKSHLASEGCMHIIELSYKYLPDHLKPCFLYFGAFPRGMSIHARKLKLLWISEGFIEENEEQCSEDLAKAYLDYLVSQNLVVVTDRSSRGGIKGCSVHDLLYDLCLQKAVEENFFHWADRRTIGQQCFATPGKYNHHRLCIGDIDLFAKPGRISTSKELPCSSVHSILWTSKDSWRPVDSFFEFSPFLETFKVLTVLDLEDVLFTLHEIPKVIMSMVHLRYIALGATYIDHIPSSIADLWNLQTLIIREPRSGVKLPSTMLEMKSLRHVNIYGCRLYFEESEKNKSSAAAFTTNMETLRAPFLSYDRDTEEFLERLPRLRKLYCYFGEEFHAKWFSMFKSQKKLESLRISYVGWFPPEINSDTFPGFKFPVNLRKLTLSGFKLPWSTMSIIGKMPNLEVLKLLHRACKGTKWDLEDGGFSKLRYLKLCGLEIEQFNASSESFPCLEELVVNDCYRLEEIPSSFGEISTLKTIKLVGCSLKASKSAWQILEQQRDFGNHSFQVFAPNMFEEVDGGGEKELTTGLKWPWRQ